ncbi:MAG: hypothetical protein AVDCRST_MAG52-2006, partial [uncultured Blastococcus sp.]
RRRGVRRRPRPRSAGGPADHRDTCSPGGCCGQVPALAACARPGHGRSARRRRVRGASDRCGRPGLPRHGHRGVDRSRRARGPRCTRRLLRTGRAGGSTL